MRSRGGLAVLPEVESANLLHIPICGPSIVVNNGIAFLKPARISFALTVFSCASFDIIPVVRVKIALHHFSIVVEFTKCFAHPRKAIERRVILAGGKVSKNGPETLFVCDFADSDTDKAILSHEIGGDILLFIKMPARVVVEVGYMIPCPDVRSPGCLRTDYEGPVIRVTAEDIAKGRSTRRGSAWVKNNE